MRSRRRRSVTSLMSTTAPTTSRSSSNGIARIRIETSPRSTSSVTGRRGGTGGGAAGVLACLAEADVGGALARGVGVDTHPMQRADGVRAREPDVRVGIEDDHAVGDPWRVLELDFVAREREGPLGDHAREPVEQLEVVTLELAATA